MDAQEFLISAREMLQKGREVDYRNAASRAYYAAYHVSREKFGAASARRVLELAKGLAENARASGG
jgi:uncharacterized protein (UPF0332 family)